MDRRRFHPHKGKRLYQLIISVALVVVNITLLLCFFKSYDLLYKPSIPFWIYFTTGVFIATKIFMVYAFYSGRTLLLDLTTFLCVILLLFQFLWGLITTFSIVLNADKNADEIATHYPVKERMIQEMIEFEDENHCCFPRSPEHEHSENSFILMTNVDHSACVGISCVDINKMKARNIAVFLITGYILIFIGLTAIIMMQIL